MQLVRWIRLDIPYQSDGKKMRAVVGHSADDGTLSTFVSAYMDNIPNTINALKTLFVELGMHPDDKTVLVYPLDGRMELAWVVKEAADKEGWEFSRHVPAQFAPSVETVCSFELEETGSQEDDYRDGQAQQLIFKLNSNAQEEYQRSDLPSAMSCLRQALQLSFKHFGWGSPGVAYSLTNFGHVMHGTGNHDNLLEFAAGVRRLLHHWDLEFPDKSEWEGADSILEQLISVCKASDLNDYVDRLSDYKIKLA